MKLTLLNMVQNILSSINGDEVNSIGDTVESMQVAKEIETAYYELFGNEDTPTFQGMFQLQNGLDPNSPTKLVLPDNVRNMIWFKYNWHTFGADGVPNLVYTAVGWDPFFGLGPGPDTAPGFNGNNNFRDVTYLIPKDFIELGVTRANETHTSLVNGPNGIQIAVRTNQPPQFWTTVDNQTLYTDGYLSSLETTVTGTNTMCFGQFEEKFQLVDNYIPLLDTDLFPLLLAEAKSACFINIKQVSSSKEEQRVRRLRYWKQKEQWKLNQRDFQDPKTNFGRRQPYPKSFGHPLIHGR